MERGGTDDAHSSSEDGEEENPGFRNWMKAMMFPTVMLAIPVF